MNEADTSLTPKRTVGERRPFASIIIPVHTPHRPIERAVASILEDNRSPLEVIVVAHNTAAEGIQNRLGHWCDDARLAILELRDGISSPAGPMNYGIERSEGDFLSFMGSDDALAPGAVDAWLTIQHETSAAVIIAPMRTEQGRMIPTPPVRLLRTRGLRLDRDRLAYRSAPLGLVSREHFGRLRFTPGLRSGEDVNFTLRLWGSRGMIVFPRSAPAYIVHDDAGDRVTYAPRQISEDFEFLNAVLEDPVIAGLGLADRRAIAVKLIRAHLFDAVRNREQHPWSREQRRELAEVATRLLAWMPAVRHFFSLRERALLDVVLEPSRSDEELNRLSRQRRRYYTPPAVLTRNPFFILHRQSPLRFGLATILLSLR